MAFLKRHNKIHLWTKHRIFKQGVHLREGGCRTSVYSCPAVHIFAFAVRSAVCDCVAPCDFNDKRPEG